MFKSTGFCLADGTSGVGSRGLTLLLAAEDDVTRVAAGTTGLVIT